MMSEFRRRLLMQNALEGPSGGDIVLPEGYTRLKYIHSDGRGAWFYIFKGRNNKGFLDIHLELKNYKPTNDKFSCIYAMNGADAAYSLYYQNEHSYFQHYMINNPPSNIDYKMTNDLVIDNIMSDGIFEANKNLLRRFNARDPFTKIYPLRIFKSDIYSWKSPICDLYNIKVKVNKELVFDMIPCINPQGDVGMINIIDNRFYKSESDIPFIAGDIA